MQFRRPPGRWPESRACATRRWSWGKLQRVALKALTAFGRGSIRAVLAGGPVRKPRRRRIFRDSRPGAVSAPGQSSCTLTRSGSDQRGDARTQVARKWRRKSLERLDSRPKMAPRLARRSASPRPVFDPQRTGQSESPVTPEAAHAGAVRRPRTSFRGAFASGNAPEDLQRAVTRRGVSIAGLGKTEKATQCGSLCSAV